MMDNLSDQQLMRYSRQIMLPAFDVAGQLALLNANVLIIGAGGLGSPAALYLAASGVGKISIVDDDVVELSNLQRQIAHGESSLGTNKAESARTRINDLNRECEVSVFAERFGSESWRDKLRDFDAVLDCSDNFDTRFSVNRLCAEASIPLVSAAAIRLEGQLSVFDFRHNESPCYRCLYSEDGEDNLNCSANGVMAPLVGVLGAMQALEAIKAIANLGSSSAGKLLIFDAMTLEWRSMRLRKDAKCPVCGDQST